MTCSCTLPNDAICTLGLMAEGWLAFAALAVVATFAVLFVILFVTLAVLQH